MYFTLDRIEGDKAVMIDENGKSLDFPIDRLGEHTEEGGIFEQTESDLVYRAELTAERRAKLAKRTKRLFNS